MASNTIAYERPWLADYQLEALFGPKRYGLIEGSTKCGKTAPCLIWLFEKVLELGQKGRSFWWVAPVYSQAEIAYRRFCDGTPASLIKKHNTRLMVEIPLLGCMVWFKSAEKADNLYGDDVYAAIVDEASRIDDDSWYALRSTLTATRGPARIIGNVKGRKNWFYKMCRTAERGDPDMSFKRITCLDAIREKILDPKEIEDARKQLPAHIFDELYMAVASGGEGRVYRDFNSRNVRYDIKDTGDTIHIGMDFNVNPMSCSISNKVVDELHQFDEITINNSNTVEMCQEIKRRYPKRDIIVYPDPSGKSRKTSAVVGVTDFSIIRANGFHLIAPEKAPPIVDRVNNVNALICNAEGRRRYFVHPKCKATIMCMEDQMFKEGTNIPDKAGGLDHMGDNIGYKISSLFPIICSGVSFAEVDQG